MGILPLFLRHSHARTGVKLMGKMPMLRFVRAPKYPTPVFGAEKTPYWAVAVSSPRRGGRFVAHRVSGGYHDEWIGQPRSGATLSYGSAFCRPSRADTYVRHDSHRLRGGLQICRPLRGEETAKNQQQLRRAYFRPPTSGGDDLHPIHLLLSGRCLPHGIQAPLRCFNAGMARRGGVGLWTMSQGTNVATPPLSSLRGSVVTFGDKSCCGTPAVL